MRLQESRVFMPSNCFPVDHFSLHTKACSMTHALKVRTLERDEMERAASFYLENGYDSALDEQDTFLVVEEGNAIVAALRLCREGGDVVLRGMRVRDLHRRRGIGTALLQHAAAVLKDESCYCIPFRSLEKFYGQIGFEVVEPAEAPDFLRDRIRIYRVKLGLDVILMYRPGMGDGS
jgi:GNAT superfamily N-acetyltransferase